MAWAYVQSRRQALHTGVAFTGNTVAGNRAILGIVAFNSSASPVVSGVSDAKNGSWHQDFLTTDATSKMTYGCFSVNIGTQLLSTDTVTVSYSSNTPSDANSSLSLLEYSGLSSTAFAADVVAGPNATHSGATAVTSGNSSGTTGANELALILYGDDNADSSSGWAAAPTSSAVRVNDMGGNVSQWIAEKDSGSSSSVISASGTQAGNEDWCIGVVVYKLAGTTLNVSAPLNLGVQAVATPLLLTARVVSAQLKLGLRAQAAPALYTTYAKTANLPLGISIRTAAPNLLITPAAPLRIGVRAVATPLLVTTRLVSASLNLGLLAAAGPPSLVSQSLLNYTAMTYELDATQIRNAILAGSASVPALQTDTFVADGLTIFWPLSYVPDTSVITPVMTANGQQRAVGSGSSGSSGNYSFTTLSPGAVGLAIGTDGVPVSGTQLSVTYAYQLPVLVLLRDAASIGVAAALPSWGVFLYNLSSSGSGATFAQAYADAQAQIQMWAAAVQRVKLTLSEEANTIGLEEGQSIEFVSNRLGLNLEMVVAERQIQGSPAGWSGGKQQPLVLEA